MDPSTHIARRPKRADGQRNYDAILAAARAAFVESGSDASLEDIAQRAGVAIGTLYRHFPSRASLVEATTREGLDSLIAHARSLTPATDPVDALTEWMTHAIDHISTFRGLVGIITRSMYDEGTPTHAACAAMHASGADLLDATHTAGRVHEHVTADDLFALLSAAGWVRENSPEGEDGSIRLVDLWLNGALTRDATPRTTASPTTPNTRQPEGP